MTWLEEMSLRDLEDGAVLEATCIRCLNSWTESALQIKIRVEHRGVYLDEVAKNLACPKRDCRHVGVRLTLVRNDDSSGFVGGMP